MSEDKVQGWMEGTAPADPPAPVEGAAAMQLSPTTDPEVTKLGDEAVRVLEYATAMVVTTPDDMKKATEDLSLIANIKKPLKAKWKEYVDPLNAQVDEINAAFKVFSQPVLTADEMLKGKVLHYNKEQRQKQEDADRAQKLIAEAQSLQEGVVAPVLPMPTSQPITRLKTDVGEIQEKVETKWRVADFSQVPDEYKIIDAGKVGKVVRAGIPSIPGIEIYKKETIAVISKKPK